MTHLVVPSNLLRSLLSPFGALRFQPATDWTGEGPLHPDVFAMAATLETIGAVQDEAGSGLLDQECVLRPAWQAALRARLVPLLDTADAERVAATLDW